MIEIFEASISACEIPHFQPAPELTGEFFKRPQKALTITLAAKCWADKELFDLKPPFLSLYG